jgi:putative flippase GtrA
VIESLESLASRARHLLHEVLRFGTVGAGAFVVDLALFNALRLETGIWDGPLSDRPITAKVVSVCVATAVSYAGNRHWTWRHRARRGVGRELTGFALLNGVGMLIAVLCLGVSHYVLGFTSALADNISANGVGLALGTVFRFWSYRRWVFPREVRRSAPRPTSPARSAGRDRGPW